MDEVARQAALADLYELPGHLLWRAAARVTAAVDRILPGGTDIHAYATLLALADAEPQTQASLAKMSAVSATTLAAVAHTLERDGLVQRIRNPEDRRSYSLTRTPRGRAAATDWSPLLGRVEYELTAAFSPDEAERLREVLRGVLAARLDARVPAALLGSTGFLVTKAHHVAHKRLLAALRPLDIEPRHIGTLRSLRITGPETQGRLSALLEVSPATVVQIVDHLEQRGLVERRRDPADRRAYRLHLTPSAEGVVERAQAAADVVQDECFGPPGGQDRQDLVRLLRRLLTASRPS